MKVGLQLYTVKDVAERDLIGTLRKVAEMGYDGVEFARYHGTSVRDIRSVLDATGLVAAGTVCRMSDLETEFDRSVDDCKAIGCSTVLFPWLDVRYRDSVDAYIRTAGILDRFGHMCREHGLRFLYHIHGYEFESVGDTTGLDLLLDHTEPENLGLELDTYWVAHGGADPVSIFRKHAQRTPYLHLKDARNNVDWHDAEVGEGIIDFPTLLRDALMQGVEWAVVEQERFTMPTLESAAISLRNVRHMIDALGMD